MSKHTSGPWRVDSRTGRQRRTWIRAGAAHTTAVASVCTTHTDAAANARLIAAAPDLLEVCELLDKCGVLSPMAQDKIRAALLKVRGSEHG